MSDKIIIHSEIPLPEATFGEAPRMVMAIIYQTQDLPPRTIRIPLAEDTPKNRAKLIREDIERARAEKPTTLDIP